MEPAAGDEGPRPVGVPSTVSLWLPSREQPQRLAVRPTASRVCRETAKLSHKPIGVVRFGYLDVRSTGARKSRRHVARPSGTESRRPKNSCEQPLILENPN